ncbi:unnamed protein product [Vitrella brassicaformis CCMP3155]|uniref:MOSC domain-containing protein n=1 Tax=Vitrella brassicaformis (strain CCMP3155) TaxID=1169540 RepID=A0A0G4G1P5_VITBC|nr:unnamed protein product [Vitrella brassicaformis CCMP3155]|eukprot:CEM21972.1 unnamed protein product [Vitrella brassicaformis CCMP3155]
MSKKIWVGALATSACVVAGGAAYIMYQSRRQRCKRRVGRVTAITVYPVKGIGGISLPAATLDKHGMMYDRNWMLIRVRNHEFLTQRQVARLCLLRTHFEDEDGKVITDGTHFHRAAYLCVSTTENMANLRVPVAAGSKGKAGGEQEYLVKVWASEVRVGDAGDAAAVWMSKYCREEVRLVRILDSSHRPLNKYYAPRAGFNGDETDAIQPALSDGYPLHLTTEESLAFLNTKLSDPVPMDRFRANIVVSADEGPWQEDGWAELLLGSDTRCFSVKPCDRCVVPTIDQQTATLNRAIQPTKTLKQIHGVHEDGGKTKSGFFGQNLVHTRAGDVIRVGDAVTVLRYMDKRLTSQFKGASPMYAG